MAEAKHKQRTLMNFLEGTKMPSTEHWKSE